MTEEKKESVFIPKKKPRKIKKQANGPFETPILTLPEGCHKLLLHTCCAPCSGSIIEILHASKIDFTIFYYNPNIHPRKEYMIRKNESKQYAEKLGIPFIDADYDYKEWFRRAKGMEHEPERGARCSMCFDMRLEKTAEYAHLNGFQAITSCLGISRWKDLKQVNGSGHDAVAKYDDVIFWDHNWRKGGCSQHNVEISKREHFYKQEYCGCAYSFRDANKWRAETGRPQIEIGVKYYGDEEK